MTTKYIKTISEEAKEYKEMLQSAEVRKEELLSQVQKKFFNNVVFIGNNIVKKKLSPIDYINYHESMSYRFMILGNYSWISGLNAKVVDVNDEYIIVKAEAYDKDKKAVSMSEYEVPIEFISMSNWQIAKTFRNHITQQKINTRDERIKLKKDSLLKELRKAKKIGKSC